MSAVNKGLPSMALYLGYGGLIPFVLLSLGSIGGLQIQSGATVSTELYLAIYAAVIISFLGAIHWGVVIANENQLSDQESNILLIYSVIPSLLAWLSFLCDIKTGLLLLSFLVVICFVVDYLILFKKLKTTIAKGFSKLRLHLTIIVSVSLFCTSINLT